MPAVKEKPDVVGRILDLRCDFMCDNPDEPTEVHLTKQVEIEVYRCMLNFFSADTDEGTILRHYGMRAWIRILGMKIIWDSDYLRVC